MRAGDAQVRVCVTFAADNDAQVRVDVDSAADSDAPLRVGVGFAAADVPPVPGHPAPGSMSKITNLRDCPLGTP